MRMGPALSKMSFMFMSYFIRRFYIFSLFFVLILYLVKGFFVEMCILFFSKILH